MNAVFLLKSTQKAEQEEAGISPHLEVEQRSGQSKGFPVLYGFGQST